MSARAKVLTLECSLEREAVTAAGEPERAGPPRGDSHPPSADHDGDRFDELNSGPTIGAVG